MESKEHIDLIIRDNPNLRDHYEDRYDLLFRYDTVAALLTAFGKKVQEEQIKVCATAFIGDPWEAARAEKDCKRVIE